MTELERINLQKKLEDIGFMTIEKNDQNYNPEKPSANAFYATTEKRLYPPFYSKTKSLSYQGQNINVNDWFGFLEPLDLRDKNYNVIMSESNFSKLPEDLKYKNNLKGPSLSSGLRKIGLWLVAVLILALLAMIAINYISYKNLYPDTPKRENAKTSVPTEKITTTETEQTQINNTAIENEGAPSEVGTDSNIAQESSSESIDNQLNSNATNSRNGLIMVSALAHQQNITALVNKLENNGYEVYRRKANGLTYIGIITNRHDSTTLRWVRENIDVEAWIGNYSGR